MKYRDDEKVIQAFLTSNSKAEIVRETGLSRNAVYRLWNDKEFRKKLQNRKTAIIQAAVNKMQVHLSKDVDILQSVIEDSAINPQTRVYAIQTLMNQLRDWTTTADILTRLEGLEQAVDNEQVETGT